MFSLIRQVFTVFLSFSEFLARAANVRTRSLSLYVKPCMFRPTLIDFKYFQVFTRITNKNEAKIIAKNVSCNSKCKFNNKTCNLNKKWNNKTHRCEWKNHRTCKKY